MKHLEEAARTIATATVAQDVLQTLLCGLREAAPRGALYLVRPDGIAGWSSFGYSSDLTFQHRAFACPRDEGWLGELSRDPAREVITLAGHGGPPVPAVEEAAETMASAVCIQDKVVAIAVGQRAVGEEPWSPYTLGTLVVVAQLRLELSLAERRAAAVTAGAAPGAVPLQASDSPVATTSRDVTLSPVEPSNAASQSLDRLAAAISPSVAAAQRFARLVATDIKLYNEQDVILGRRDGDLVDRLRRSLEQGRESFLERHADLGDEGLRLLHDAYVQVLAGGEASLLASLDQ